MMSMTHSWYRAPEGASTAFAALRQVPACRLVVLVTADEARARESAQACRLFLGQDASRVEWLPGSESPYMEGLSDPGVQHARMSLLARLHFGEPPRVLVASVAALMRRTLHRAVFDALSVLVGPQVRFAITELAGRLVDAGYTRVEVVEDEGTFAVRGQVLDVFVPSQPSPARITWFDDEIEHIHLFDAQTQKRYLPVPELLLHPVHEAVRGDPDGLRERLYRAADRAGFPSTKTRFILERMEAGESFFGMEMLAPLYHDGLVPLSDYFPEKSTIILENPGLITHEWDGHFEQERNRFQVRLADRQLVLPPEEHLCTLEELCLDRWPGIGTYPEEPLDPGDVDMGCTSHHVLPAGRDAGLAPLRERVRKCLETGQPLVFATVDAPAHSAIARILGEDGIPVQVLPPEEPLSFPLVSGVVLLRRGHLGRGFDCPEVSVFSEEEWVGVKAATAPPKRSSSRPSLASVEVLNEGDAVVHAVHGVGIYRGLYRESPAGIPGDYLLLEYEGGDRLYLPAHRVSLLSRYRIAGEETTVKLDKLGGKTWAATKKKVSHRVRDLAEKLLMAASARESRPPLDLSGDDAMLLEFEATFPYEETQDQIRAIHDVTRDLRSDKPMDRLICGDVGYGKTEVALRAAFMAVAGGRQVALLAPTTLLVEQHARTFSERMAGFPVRVASLSRFTSPAAKKETLAQLALGRVDIVIGTHRLLSRDVHFSNLGLLIVDEEQKFGVAQKEQFRFWKPGVDVLTLTATPIPRTLQMGLVGLRDISIIHTPPRDRLAVRSLVAPLGRATVVDAIRREHARGGQVFVVVPRIGLEKRTGTSRSVDDWAVLIREWVPEVRVEAAHGRMEPARLERIMLSFLHGSVDVLVSTTIVESGLDISRANTLLVMDSHLFGLAQLYQLRGRVGRSSVRAFACFFLPEKATVTPEARRRLAALVRHSSLGSGFALASEDMEIRGAGEVLGARQSGMMSQVGFETYMEIVQQVAAELRDEPLPVLNDPELHVDMPAYFSEEMIPEPAERLIWYRRMALAGDVQELEGLREVLTDRYGMLEPEGETYFSLMEIKILARAINATGIGIQGSRLTVHLDRHARLDPLRVAERIQTSFPFTFADSNRMTATLKGCASNGERLAMSMEHLQKLLSCVTHESEK